MGQTFIGPKKWVEYITKNGEKYHQKHAKPVASGVLNFDITSEPKHAAVWTKQNKVSMDPGRGHGRDGELALDRGCHRQPSRRA